MSVCAECGYDLRGLEMPHACPECGYRADPTGDREIAVQWYGSWRGLFFRRPPPMVTGHLSDPRCRKVAVRRVWLLGVLPWLLSTVAILGFFSIVIERDLEIWWESPTEPGRRFSAHTATEQERPLRFSLHFRGLFRFRPADSTLRTKLRAVRFRWAWRAPDPFEIGILAISTFNLLGIPFLWVTTRLAHRWRDGDKSEAARPPPMLLLVGLLAPWHCLCAIALFVFGCLSILVLVCGVDSWFAILSPLVWLAYLIPGGVLTVRILRGMRPRRRNYSAVVLMPVCVVWFVVHIAAWIGLIAIVDRLFRS